MVLEIDVEKRRISLGIKQCIDNPWEDYKSKNKVGEVIEGEIRNITEFGLFVGLSEDIDGLVHLSDLNWDGNGDELIKTYSKGSSLSPTNKPNSVIFLISPSITSPTLFFDL
jgi:small subunit ribosomal protein S1